MQSLAHAKDNEALRLACKWGLETVALNLLDQEEVRKNAHLVNNAALKNTCFLGLETVAMKLLDQKEVRDNLDTKNDKMQYYFSIWKDRGDSAEKQVISKLDIHEDAQTIGNKKGG
ncbi:MAG TPA: hypothetical protein QF353_02505 [Gammaproteobacteria bacterium]|nr:hypothetical protein [Gammaproteobacteria bacterium]